MPAEGFLNGSKQIYTLNSLWLEDNSSSVNLIFLLHSLFLVMTDLIPFFYSILPFSFNNTSSSLSVPLTFGPGTKTKNKVKDVLIKILQTNLV